MRTPATRSTGLVLRPRTTAAVGRAWGGGDGAANGRHAAAPRIPAWPGEESSPGRGIGRVPNRAQVNIRNY